MPKIMGTALSGGIVCGAVSKINFREAIVMFEPAKDKGEEKNRVREGLKLAYENHKKLIERCADSGETKNILTSYLYMIKDPDLEEQIDGVIDAMNCSAEYAVKVVFDKIILSMFTCSDDYLRSRGEDLRHVLNNIICVLSNEEYNNLEEITPGSILVAHQLSPAQLAYIEFGNIAGIITTASSPNSHLAIMARSAGTPAISCSAKDLSKLANGQLVILDGAEGIAVTDPSVEDMAFYDDQMYQQKIQQEKVERFRWLEGITSDGNRVPVQANVSSLKDMELSQEQGAEGVGLVRTELLFLSGKLPDWKKQLEVYRQIVEHSPGNSVVFRTFDFGSDKLREESDPQEYGESNPALGYRAIRMMHGHQQLFHEQIKALLMASSYGEVTILLPFVTSPDEVQEVKDMMQEIRREILAEGGTYSENAKLGVMIEVPSAALLADEIASMVDMLSIGTNDLTQFTLAVDRSNSQIAHLFMPYHPAVLRLISITADAGKRHHIPVCVCGEMAGEPYYVKLLIGLGVTQLSVSPASIRDIKATLGGFTMEEAVIFASQVMNTESVKEVKQAIYQGNKPTVTV